MRLENILVLENVSKKFKDLTALCEVSLTVKKGEWISIMGPSGSGKTTLMNIIGCMSQATSGKIYLDGKDISGLSSKELTCLRRDKIGLIFQQFHLISYLNAVENVMVAQYYHSMSDEKEALSALENVGLSKRAKHLPSQLSGGEQQRLCIARALLNFPMLILADEPTGNLDETNELVIIDLLKRLHKQGATIIVVTHDPEVADKSERTIILDHGRISKIKKNNSRKL